MIMSRREPQLNEVSKLLYNIYNCFESREKDGSWRSFPFLLNSLAASRALEGSWGRELHKNKEGNNLAQPDATEKNMKS